MRKEEENLDQDTKLCVNKEIKKYIKELTPITITCLSFYQDEEKDQKIGHN